MSTLNQLRTESRFKPGCPCQQAKDEPVVADANGKNG
jgi:hypothetical protein